MTRWDNFSGVAGRIEGLRWWGVHQREIPGFPPFDCIEPAPVFRVSFHADHVGTVGTLICSETVTATRTETGVFYNGAQLIEFNAGLSSPCAVVDGWISIVGEDDPFCEFRWLSSPTGDGTSVCDTCTPTVQPFDLSFCLEGTPGGVFGACCDQAGGACVDQVEISSCTTPGQRFAAETTCAAMDPPCGLSAGACCDGGSLCSIESEAQCLLEGHHWLGPDTFCGGCPMLPACPASGVLLSRSPPDPTEPWEARISEITTPFQQFQAFDGVAGEVLEITWWGLDMQQLGPVTFVECVETDNTFDISFHRDLGGAPGPAECSYTLVASRTPTGIVYRGAELNEYHVTLPAPCLLIDGHLSIVGRGDPACLFLWINATSSDDYSYCLHGTAGGIFGACCDDGSGLCSDNVEIVNCIGPYLRFERTTLCGGLTPACGQLTGGCCFDGGVCAEETEFVCDNLGGLWTGGGTTCADCPITGACCQGANAQGATVCGLTEEAPCLEEGGSWLGQNTSCGNCPALPDCPPVTLLSQGPIDPLQEPEFTPSEISTVFKQFDHVSGVGAAIDGLTWWGLDIDYVPALSAFQECAELDTTFHISFYEDAGGVPGAAVCSYTVVASRTPQNIRYFGPIVEGGAELNEYHVTLPTPCVMTNGWVSIVGDGDPECWFMWARSLTGDSLSFCEGCIPDIRQVDLAVCLEGVTGGVFGACCDDATAMCSDNVEITGCLGIGQRFAVNSPCSSLSPPCGVVIGACCLNDATCSTLLEPDCQAASGNWLGANSLCDRCPCITPCPAGGVAEGEPTCFPGYIDLFNAGCNAAVPAFSPISIGDTICGTSGVAGAVGGGIPDYDWYELTVTETTQLEFNVHAEFEAAAWILDGNSGCANPAVLDVAGALECESIALSASVSPGVYWFLIHPVVQSDPAACGARYTATLALPSQCPGAVRGDLDGNGVVDPADIPLLVDTLLGLTGPFEQCVADLNGDFAADGLDLAPFLGVLLAPEPTGACCQSPSGPGCVEVTQVDCVSIHNGLYLGDGTSCLAANCGGAPISVSQVVFSLNPAQNCPGTIIESLVNGSGFQPGATARLSRPGHADIHATAASVQPGGTQITNVLFDLSFAAPGFWQVVVANPDNGFAVAPDLLEITSCP